MTAGADAVAMAAEAGLRYLSDDIPGFRRIRRGSGFSYVDQSGETLEGREKARASGLVIPPAWTEVWISPDARGHIQATGYDDAGRKQYIYHPEWERIRDEVKFDRLGLFGRRVDRLRKAVDGDLRRPGLDRDKAVALAVAVLDRTLIRIGNRRYTDENETYGLTTLTTDHVDVTGSTVTLVFDGKGRSEYEVAFKDRRLARHISACQELDGQTLFSYQNGSGPSPISSGDVNSYVNEAMGGPFTAKDFRTWGATTTVARHLATTHSDDASDKLLLAAIDEAADRLGNTRSVLRSSYLHPEIPEAFADGRLTEAWRTSRRGKWVDRAESTVRRLLRN